MDEPVIKTDTKRMRDAASLIATGFDWASSPQGFRYWREAHYALSNLALAAEVTEREAERAAAKAEQVPPAQPTEPSPPSPPVPPVPPSPTKHVYGFSWLKSHRFDGSRAQSYECMTCGKVLVADVCVYTYGKELSLALRVTRLEHQLGMSTLNP